MIWYPGGQINRYYVWINNIWKYIIYKSVRMEKRVLEKIIRKAY